MANIENVWLIESLPSHSNFLLCESLRVLHFPRLAVDTAAFTTGVDTSHKTFLVCLLARDEASTAHVVWLNSLHYMCPSADGNILSERAFSLRKFSCSHGVVFFPLFVEKERVFVCVPTAGISVFPVDVLPSFRRTQQVRV